eukprot:jgi/Undpi1/13188/HiC_scaffold_8.g02850.m1
MGDGAVEEAQEEAGRPRAVSTTPRAPSPLARELLSIDAAMPPWRGMTAVESVVPVAASSLSLAFVSVTSCATVKAVWKRMLSSPRRCSELRASSRSRSSSPPLLRATSCARLTTVRAPMTVDGLLAILLVSFMAP